MKYIRKQVLFSMAALLVVSAALLSGCSLLGGGDTSDLEDRIAKLEDKIDANTQTIASLQQLIEAQKTRIDNLTTVAKPAPPPTPTTPPPPTSNKTGLLATSSVSFGPLTITPQTVAINGAVTISITITNTSAASGTYPVAATEVMTVPSAGSNPLEYSEKVTLAAGETKTVTFTSGRSSTGTYKVDVGGKSGTYTVTE